MPYKTAADYVNTETYLVSTKTAAYTLTANDNGNIIEVDTTSGSITITVPAGLPVGFQVAIVNVGANSVVLAAGTGATLNAVGLNLTSQWTSAAVYRRATADTYIAFGDLS